MQHCYRLFAIVIIFVLTACGTGDTQLTRDSEFTPLTPGLGALPLDGVQPWESVDSAGLVVPARNASAFSPDSEFAAGVDRFLEGGDVTDNGDATTLTAPAGVSEVSYALYRFVLGGTQPAAIAIDTNLQLSGGALSEYWVGVSDYGNDRWEWHGPFSEAQVTFAVDQSGDYLSPLGNIFIAIAAYDGAVLDVVGVTVSPENGADGTPPPAPAAPTLTPAVGGLELSWADVIAADLAGYRVYWSYSPFAGPLDNGVQALPWLENTTRMFLPTPLNRQAWVAIRAVDTNGNESLLSPLVNGRRLASGSALTVSLSTPETSVLRGDPLSLTASGADFYDFDTDGDGDFDITGDPSGTASVDTSATGIIRPRVRATNSEGTAVAFGSVSLIVSGNQRPVANAQATPSFGNAPLNVAMNGTGEDFDGSIAEYAWDFDGDGIYDHNSPADGITAETYTVPGLYNAKLRVTDDQGAWDVDTVAIQVTDTAVDGPWTPVVPQPDTGPAAYNSDLVNVNGRPAIAYIANDFAGILELRYVRATNAQGTAWSAPITVDVDGGYDTVSMAIVAGNPAISYYNDVNDDLMFVRATDQDGTTWGLPQIVDGSDDSGSYSTLLVVQGNPAISYKDNTNYDLHYVRATTADGSAWGLPINVHADGNDTGTGASMALIAGSPAIAYFNNDSDTPMYVRATHPTGASWGTPDNITLGSTGDTSQLVLKELNGLPIVAFRNQAEKGLSVARGISVDGLDYVVQQIDYGTSGDFVDMEVIDNYATLLYIRALGEMVIRRAATQNAATWFDATPVGGYAVSSRPDLELVNGGLAASFGVLNFEAFEYGLAFYREP